VHVELFAERRVVVVPAGVGVASPRRGSGVYIRAGRCYGPEVTFEPTGLVEVAPGAARTLGELFAAWGQPLGPRRLAGFAGAPVSAFVDGAAYGGDPRALTLRRHAVIVLEIAGFVPPHAAYAFPPGVG
jgi:hypothetical protein